MVRAGRKSHFVQLHVSVTLVSAADTGCAIEGADFDDFFSAGGQLIRKKNMKNYPEEGPTTTLSNVEETLSGGIYYLPEGKEKHAL